MMGESIIGAAKNKLYSWRTQPVKSLIPHYIIKA